MKATIREASFEDISQILKLYRQSDMDNGKGLTEEKHYLFIKKY